MAKSMDSVSEPFPISKIGGRYLLFDVNVVTYLRRAHHICGSFMGTLPQAPQQNLFLGLPVEIMTEEAKLLVEKGVAYIVDDAAWHVQRYNTLEGEDRKKYLNSLRDQGIKARNAAQLESRKKSEHHFKKLAAKKVEAAKTTTEGEAVDVSINDTRDSVGEDSLFGEDTSEASSTPTFRSSASYVITPTSSSILSSSPRNPIPQSDPNVPPSYPLFKHLHSKGYYIMPGLRFGCDYNVYPGDPLRFHSHFLAVGYKWDQEITLLDIIGGGRLGTAVKKGFLVGGVDSDSKSEGDMVRTFAIEWGGM